MLEKSDPKDKNNISKVADLRKVKVLDLTVWDFGQGYRANNEATQQAFA